MDRLPPEMIMEIFSYLDIADLARCSRISTGFSHLLREPPMKTPIIRYHQIVDDKFTDKDRLPSSDMRAMNRFVYHFGHNSECYSVVNIGHICQVGFQMTTSINLRVIASINGRYLFKGGIHTKEDGRYANVSFVGLAIPSQGKLDLFSSRRLDETNRKRITSVFKFPLPRVAQWPGRDPPYLSIIRSPADDAMVD